MSVILISCVSILLFLTYILAIIQIDVNVLVDFGQMEVGLARKDTTPYNKLYLKKVKKESVMKKN